MKRIADVAAAARPILSSFFLSFGPLRSAVSVSQSLWPDRRSLRQPPLGLAVTIEIPAQTDETDRGRRRRGPPNPLFFLLEFWSASFGGVRIPIVMAGPAQFATTAARAGRND